MSLGILFFGSSASAAESASFKMYDSFPNVSNPGTESSDSFLMNENSVTWVAQPVVSTHFQIVTAPPVSSSSVSSVSSGVSTSSVSSTSPSAGGHRGNRIPPVLHPSAEQGSSSSSFASSIPFISSASSASSVLGVLLPPVASVSGITESPCVKPLHPSASCTEDLCQCEQPWSIGGLCVAVSRSLWSRTGIIYPAIQTVLLLLFICLFFVSQKRYR